MEEKRGPERKRWLLLDWRGDERGSGLRDDGV